DYYCQSYDISLSTQVF
nr:immunoglobulin light chain junction region [Macaca mulatta]MOV95511.1 immunoglobulin light chain junction region [Macaca mulatta]MOV96118.1 immunoglobulin light chain junction region [Macaca mulatta]MOV96877.1 immunoglobulin light chain junction region [Macaca mulatta]MOW00382.1 immunoglobulin light chain junction region [Macaca mulatta]